MHKVMLFLFFLFISNVALSAEQTNWGKITGYYTGWGEDKVRVTIEGALYNEEPSCVTTDGYMTVKSDDTGFNSHVSALLAAFMGNKEVRIVVEGCVANRPRIWGVYIR